MQKQTFLYKQAADYLAGLIVAHLGEPDYKLPTELQVEQTLCMSRITVRKAFSLFEELNVITRVKRSGTSINPQLHREAVLTILTENGLLTGIGKTKTYTIVVIVSKLEDAHHINGIVSGIVLNSDGVNVIVDSSEMSLTREQQLIDKYLAMQVDGIILYPVDNEIYNPGLLQLATSHFPLILVDRLLPGLSLPYISSDQEHMVALALEYLRSKNHEHILYFNANLKTNSSLTLRKESYLNGLYSIRNYCPYFYNFEGDSDPTSRSFCPDFLEFLKINTRLTAIIAADYSSGMHLRSMLQLLGQPYSDQFEVVYLDFYPSQFAMLPASLHPTYVTQDSFRIGAQAMELMKQALSGNDITNAKILLPVKLVTSPEHQA